MSNITQGPWSPKPAPLPGGSVVASGGNPPHDGGMDVRLVKLEVCMEFVQRELNEVKVDGRSILQRIGSIDSTLAGISERMDRFPTKLQLSLWAGGGLVALLAVAAALIAMLLRLGGHNEAAGAVDAIRGK